MFVWTMGNKENIYFARTELDIIKIISFIELFSIENYHYINLI